MTDQTPDTDIPTLLSRQNDLLEQVVDAVGHLQPRVDAAVKSQVAAVKSQMRASRTILAALVLTVVVVVGAVGCVVWQRQDQATHERIRQCRGQNANRADAEVRWAVVWDSLEKAIPGPNPQVEAVRRSQANAFDPIPCK